MSRKTLIYLILLTSFLLPSRLWAATAQGVFTVVKGKVEIHREGKAKAIKAKVGVKVFAQDKITADKNSRAKIVMNDENILNLSPDSQVVLEDYSHNPQQGEKKVVLQLVYGKVRSTVKQKYDEEKNVYRVKTPSAVAGVRGTDFFVDYNRQNQQSQVVTFEGQVQVGSGIGNSGAILNPVLVNPGQTTIASVSAPPAPPVSISNLELQKLEQNSQAEVAQEPTTTKEPRSPSSNGPVKPNTPAEPATTTPDKTAPANDKGQEARRPNSVVPSLRLAPPPPTENLGLPGDVFGGVEPIGEFDRSQPLAPAYNDPNVRDNWIDPNAMIRILQQSTLQIIVTE